MSINYAVSTHKGSSTYSGYLNTIINGPLSTNNYPNVLPYHNNGVLNGLRPTPPQFYPYQEPPYSTENSNARQHYLRATSHNKNLQENKQIQQPNYNFNFSSGRREMISNNVNYIAPVSSSLHLNEKKSVALGKQSYKIGLPLSAETSTKNYNTSSVRSSLRRARSSGCIAPKKKGSVYNIT